VTAELEVVSTAGDVFPRILAQGYARAGMPDHALRWLEIAVDSGFINFPFLSRFDPFLETLRPDRRFQQLMERVRRHWDAFST
jgi:hypothetical protein